jgi:sensor histidine kinase YesM
MHAPAPPSVILHTESTDAARKSRLLYSGMQVGCWSLYYWGQAAAEVLIAEVPWRKALFMWGGLCIASIFLTHMVRGVSKVNGWFGLPPRQLLVLGIMSTGMITLILCIIAVLIALPIYGSPVTAMYASVLHKLPLVWQLFCQFVVLGATLAVWVVIYFSIMLQRRRHRAELRQAQLSEALQEAELQLLKFQLNPHFLFNALNGVRALIADEPRKAQDAVTQLARTLRYTLAAGDADLVTLAREMEMVNDYLALESLRLADRLDVVREIEPGVENVRVPAMLMQTLVENAIKHGIAPLKHGGTLHISARTVGKELHIEIGNPRPMDDVVPHEGIGLRNTSARLRLLFGQAASLKVDLLDPARATAHVRIPL